MANTPQNAEPRQISQLLDITDVATQLAGSYVAVDMPNPAYNPVSPGAAKPFLTRKVPATQVGNPGKAPNQGKSLLKSVRFFDASTPSYVAGASTLTSLPTAGLCLNTICEVDLGPDGAGQKYRLVADPTGPLAVFADADFTGDLVQARWVLVGSPQEVISATQGAAFNPLTDFYPGPGGPDSPAAVVFYIIGELRAWRAIEDLVRSSFPDKRIPAPTGQPDDPCWEEAPLPTTQILIHKTLTVGLARAIVAESAESVFSPGFTYRLSPRIDKSSGEAILLPDVLVVAGTRSALKLEEAYEVPAGAAGPLTPVHYDLDADQTTPRSSGTGAGGVSQELFNSLNATVSSQAVRIGTLEARANSVAGLFRRNGQVAYLSASQLNTLMPAEGDVVSLLNGINAQNWVLKNGVTYHTNGIPLKVDLITDNGVSVFAKVLGSSPYSTTKRFASFTGSATNVTLEGIDLLHQGEPGGGTTITVANGATVRLSGLFNGQGGVGARVSEGSKFYYSGFALAGGGHLVWASETAYVEFRMTNSTGYYQAPIRAEGSAVVDVYSAGFLNPNGTGYALSQAVRAFNNATVNLRTGSYSNSGGQPTLLLSGTARVNVSSEVTVFNSGVAVYGTDGTELGLHAGATIVGTVDVGVTQVPLPSDKAEQQENEGEATEYQAQVSDITTKFCGVVLRQPMAFALTELINTPGWLAQVINTTTGLGYGPQRSTAAEVTADIAAAFAVEPVPSSVELKVAPASITDPTRVAYILFSLS
jgi:hypothetical protein